MKVGVFSPRTTGDPIHDETLTAFCAGVNESGDHAESHFVVEYVPCDVAVVFGIRKDAVPLSQFRGNIIDRHKAEGKPVIVIDSGYVKRDKYFAVGLNGLNGRADFKNANSPADRWQSLGVDLAPWREDGGLILLCGQIPWDASVQHTDHLAWCEGILKRLKEATTKETRYRPHPKLKGVVNQVPLAQEMESAHAVVTFSSNSGVDAAIAGVAVFAFDEGSMAWPVANKSLAWIDSPIKPPREQWAHNLAYTQWTIEEMKEGKPWRHLFH